MSSHVTSKAGSGARAPDGDEIARLATGQLLFDWDTSTDVVSYGGAYERVLGYSLAELSGDLARWIGLVHPEDRNAFNDVVRHVLATKTPSHQRYRLRRKDGSFIVVESSDYPVLARDGSILRIVCLVADVSERQNAEAICAEDAETSAALARVGRELMSSLETPVLLERLCRLTAQVLDCDFSTTWIWQTAEEVYAPISGHGLSHEEWEALRVLRVPRGPSSPLRGLEVDDLVYVTGDSTDAPVTAAVLAHYGFSGTLCMPLRRGGELIGVQAAGYRRARRR